MRGGSYDTRPVFIHPARTLSSAELEDGIARLKAWHAWLATHPEARTLTRDTPDDAGRRTDPSPGGVGEWTGKEYETRNAESSVLDTQEESR
jgi:hypothetical protein